VYVSSYLQHVCTSAACQRGYIRGENVQGKEISGSPVQSTAGSVRYTAPPADSSRLRGRHRSIGFANPQILPSSVPSQWKTAIPSPTQKVDLFGSIFVTFNTSGTWAVCVKILGKKCKEF